MPIRPLAVCNPAASHSESGLRLEMQNSWFAIFISGFAFPVSNLEIIADVISARFVSVSGRVAPTIRSFLTPSFIAAIEAPASLSMCFLFSFAPFVPSLVKIGGVLTMQNEKNFVFFFALSSTCTTLDKIGGVLTMQNEKNFVFFFALSSTCTIFVRKMERYEYQR